MGWPGRMTLRQLEAWTEWLEEQWNEPSRTDHYLMQIACEVANVLRKKRIPQGKFKIPFKFVPKEGKRGEYDETASFGFWGAMVAAAGGDLGQVEENTEDGN